MESSSAFKNNVRFHFRLVNVLPYFFQTSFRDSRGTSSSGESRSRRQLFKKKKKKNNSFLSALNRLVLDVSLLTHFLKQFF